MTNPDYTPEPIDLDSLRAELDATRKTSPPARWADGVACGHGTVKRDCEWCNPASMSTGTARECPGHGPLRETYYCDGRCQRRIHPPAVPNRVTDPETRTTADALRDTANHHQGARVHAADAGHGRDMRRAGLVGPRGGLTRKGSIAAERLREAALDDAFGPL